MTARTLLILGWLSSFAGCSTPANPDFSVAPDDLRAAIDRLRAEPRPLDRPLLVLDGWRQPDFSAWALARSLRALTGADAAQVLAASYMTRADIDAIADDVVQRVERRWPSEDPDWTTEVDAVGFSMGGIVARTAALDRPGPGKRLKVRRLYTLASPHRGARLARYVALDRAARDLRPGSDFLRRLNDALPSAPYDLVCYAHTNDVTVGATNAAPPGQEPIWTKGTLVGSHFMTRMDPLILADIALRLRNEPPLALGPSAPPCD